MKINLQQAENILKNGGIIAYPTEAVYGLGCDIFNEEAVLRLLKVKRRTMDKGLIVIVNSYQQLMPLINLPVNYDISVIKASWPGPVTWVFPASNNAPKWITGKHQAIAIRFTAHPIASKLCQFGPIVSTSANLAGLEPATDFETVTKQFAMLIDGIVDAPLGKESKPSQIIDALTQKTLRD